MYTANLRLGARAPNRVALGETDYLRKVMYDFLIDFIARRRAKPFSIYYSMFHVRGVILPTPDRAPDSKDLYADNIAYMDELVGRLVGDNGTAGGLQKVNCPGQQAFGRKRIDAGRWRVGSPDCQLGRQDTCGQGFARPPGFDRFLSRRYPAIRKSRQPSLRESVLQAASG